MITKIEVLEVLLGKGFKNLWLFIPLDLSLNYPKLVKAKEVLLKLKKKKERLATRRLLVAAKESLIALHREPNRLGTTPITTR